MGTADGVCHADTMSSEAFSPPDVGAVSSDTPGPAPDVDLDTLREIERRVLWLATRMIDHANLFLLLDREGRIAYRLSLGDQQERWLVTALQVLLRERAEPSVIE